MSFETIEFQLRDGVGRLTLNRPDAANAMNLAMVRELVSVAEATLAGRPGHRLRHASLIATRKGLSKCSRAIGWQRHSQSSRRSARAEPCWPRARARHRTKNC